MTQQVGKYQLIRKLANGGMAEVFLAKAAGPMGFEKTLVLKRILPHLAEEPAFVEMFLSEAKLAARLTHPHIVQIFDFGEADGAHFLAMEYIDGPSLRALIKRASALGLSLPPAVCARLISHACEGLAFAHDFTDPETGEALGLIHRDISPDNILLSRQGAVKVVDFGIAKAAGQGTRTESGVIKGKLAYMPPEQIRARPLDRRVDVYALGVVLYELLTARRPFVSNSDVGLMQAILFSESVPAVQLRPDLPEALQRILARALAKEREQRYPDCHAFQAELEHFILSAGKPVTTQQIAQLITQTTSSTELPVSPPNTAREGTRYTVTPFHTPAPGNATTDVSASVEASPEPTTLPASPARPGAPLPPARMEAGPRSAPVNPQRAPRWKWALMGAVLLAAGTGVVLWRTLPTPAPREPIPETREVQPTVASPEPSPEPSPDDAGMRAEASPVEPAPAAPSPAPQVPVTPEDSRPSRTVVPPKPKPSSKVVRKGTLELRIRPYAIVFVDGKDLGDTPLAPVELPAGQHAVRLINTKLSKNITRIVEVKADQNTLLKVNLNEE